MQNSPLAARRSPICLMRPLRATPALLVADRWGSLMAQAGRSMPAIDSLLAATAMVHGLQMVTRNQKDFAYLCLQTINPWLPA